MTVDFLVARVRRGSVPTILACCLLLSVFAAPAMAGPESDSLIDDAITVTRATDYEAALLAVADAIERDA